MARRTRTFLAAAATGLALAGAFAVAPASAGTVSTITLTAGGTALSISEPTGTDSSPKSLGSTASAIGPWTSGALGAVTVTDGRTGLLANNWSASATVTDFAYVGTAPEGATTAQTTILASSMLYNVGTVTEGSENGAVSTFASVGGAIVANTVVVGSMVAVGPNSASYNPTLTVALVNQLAGTYRGTITHSAL